MRELTSIAKALADPNRVRALWALKGHELCVCQIVELLGLAPSTVSKHLSILKQSGLVESRKEGRWIYYRRPRKGMRAPVQAALQWIDGSLSASTSLCDDERKLERILRVPLDVLCRPEPDPGSRGAGQ